MDYSFNHNGRQSRQWTEEHSHYVNSDALQAYQSTGRNLPNTTSLTASIVPDNQFYSCASSSHPLTSFSYGQLDPTGPCVNPAIGPDYSACQELPSALTEAPMNLTPSQHYPVGSDYSPIFSQADAQESALSTFMIAQDMEHGILPGPEEWSGFMHPGDYCAVEDPSTSVNHDLPLSPVSLQASTPDTCSFSNLPASMNGSRRPSYVLPDDCQGQSTIPQDRRYCDDSYYAMNDAYDQGHMRSDNLQADNMTIKTGH